MNAAVRVLSVREVAEILRCTPPVVYGMVKRGEIHGVKVGRLVRIPAEEVSAFLAGEAEKPKADDRR